MARTVAFGHVGLQVADLERSVGYYRDVIGLEVVERIVRDDAYLKVVTGYPEVTLDIALLREPASGVLLELLQYRGTAGTPVDAATVDRERPPSAKGRRPPTSHDRSEASDMPRAAGRSGPAISHACPRRAVPMWL